VILTFILSAILAGSLAYCVLMVVAAARFLRQAKHDECSAHSGCPAISVLKPLSGADEGLEENLRSFFEQDYPQFEIICAVRHPYDAALPVMEKLQQEYSGVSSRLLITGDSDYANAKVYSQDRMLDAASHDLLVLSDSDIRVGPGFLRSVAGEFDDPMIAVATCPYRAVAGRSLWSRLEAVGMNTEFWGGVLVARMLEGVRFAVGPTVVARRKAIEAIHGFHRLKDYIADDFALGQFATNAGCGVILSRTLVEHRIGSESLRDNAMHRIRWARSSRRSRPAGYVGQIFTNPLPIALLLCAGHPMLWPVLIPTLLLRSAAAWAASAWILRQPVSWLLLPLQDLMSFGFWIAGFFGNTVTWRGRRYYLYPDGRCELLM
jgi:ceramide glucosyltransferase